jgi:hypothetical protein
MELFLLSVTSKSFEYDEHILWRHFHNILTINHHILLFSFDNKHMDWTVPRSNTSSYPIL